MNTDTNNSRLNVQSLINSAAQKHRLGELDEAESLYRQVLNLSPQSIEAADFSVNRHRLMTVFGTVLEQQGKLEAAAQSYQQALRLKPDYAQAYYNLGNVLIRQNKLEAAIESYGQAIRNKPDYVLGYYNLANAYRLQGKLEAAVELFERAIAIKPDYAEAYNNLGTVFDKQGNLEAAVESYRQALRIKPDYALAYNNLGTVLKQQGKLEAAAQSYRQALRIKPDYALAHNNLGTVLIEQGKTEAAVESYEQALSLQPDFALAYNNLGNALKEQSKLEAAIESYRQALQFKPDFAMAYYNLGNALKQQGKLKAAVESFEQALKLQPDCEQAKFGILMGQLPIIYRSVEEIQWWRNQYQQHLQQLAQSYEFASTQQLAQAAEAVGSFQPFYLAYQGLNDRSLQQTYGAMILRLMSSRYPQWSRPLPLPDSPPGSRIRVGIVSAFFNHHSNWKIPIRGWVENLDRNRFELFGYHTAARQDDETARAAQAFSKFVQGPLPVANWGEIISQDELHVLIFPEFGMDPTTVQLGCLRLAPVQMTSWGHPETSGLPTIDYYLSSDLMEPATAQENYSEQLVRLPNLSIYYQPLEVEPQTVAKHHLGMKEDEPMFWCCQSLYKYLPQHDDVFPRIAQQLSSCKFVFIQNRSEEITDVFRQRLKQAFEQYGLNEQDYCVFLPRLKPELFAGTTAIADVFLDSIGWSGCNSALEAIAYNLPLVTWPGELMRGRHTMAILKMMGMERAIADSKEEYVQIAVRLAQDRQYRQYWSRQVAQNKHKLYGDRQPIRALEDFLWNVVTRTSPESPVELEAHTSSNKPKPTKKRNKQTKTQAHQRVVQSLVKTAVQQHQAGKLNEAESIYRYLLSIQPNNGVAQVYLGKLLRQQNRLAEAIASYQTSLQTNPNNLVLLNNLGTALKQQNQLEAAIKCFQQSLKIKPEAEVYYNLGNTFRQQGKLEAAVKSYQQALTLDPDCEPAKFGVLMGQLPIIYENEAEIQWRRSQYQKHLQELAHSYQQASPQARAKAAEAVGSLQPFLLTYQGLNDRALQQTYGEMIVGLMSSRYPQWSRPLPLPNLAPGSRIRVGIVSGFFNYHSNWKIPIRGWVENLDRNRFELFGYHTDNRQDSETHRATKAFSKFVQGPLPVEDWAEIISQDQLHVLIFPEFGMDPTTVQLGCLRLAPIQMNSLGHPETGGMPTIDYYLSSDLMEPATAQDHYSEQLVRLPNLSIYYEPSDFRPEPITKADIGIRPDETMFWCCQSLFKYLPQHDDVFPRIAQQTSNCKFVFIKYNADANEKVTDVFRQRLKQAFAQFELDYQNYCIFLPRMNPKEFAKAAAVADVFLDSIGWSGFNSALETIAHNVPLVICPGELMRGRHTLAILKMLGIQETIAQSKEEYVQIAVRLGQDQQYRQHLSELVAQNKHKLYRDLEPVHALEEFLIKITTHEEQ